MKEFIFVESVGSGHGKTAISLVKRLGYQIAFFTQTPEFYRGWGVETPFEEVDRIVETNTLSATEMAPHVDTATVAGIMALDDFHLLPAAELASRFGLPHPSLEAIARARYKEITRQTLAEAGETRPAFGLYHGNEIPAESPVGYPCVVKPTDGTGSVGVQICLDKAEFQRAIPMLRQWRRIRDYSLRDIWLVEEFIDGPEFSAELVWNAGQWVLVGFTRKIVSPPPFAIELGHVFPYQFSGSDQERISKRIVGWLSTLGLDFGAAHVEFRISDGQPILMEVNARIGGDMIPELIRLTTGFDLIAYVCTAFAGRDCEGPSRDEVTERAASVRFITPPVTGGVRLLHGLEDARLAPSVSQCVITNARPAARHANSNYDRIGFVIATGNDGPEAEHNAAEGAARIRFL